MIIVVTARIDMEMGVEFVANQAPVIGKAVSEVVTKWADAYAARSNIEITYTINEPIETSTDGR